MRKFDKVFFSALSTGYLISFVKNRKKFIGISDEVTIYHSIKINLR